MYVCVCARMHVYVYAHTIHRCSRAIMCTVVHVTTCPVRPAGDDIGCTHVYINTEMHTCACACVRMRMPVYVCMYVLVIVALVLSCVLPCTLLLVRCDQQAMIVFIYEY